MDSIGSMGTISAQAQRKINRQKPHLQYLPRPEACLRQELDRFDAARPSAILLQPLIVNISSNDSQPTGASALRGGGYHDQHGSIQWPVWSGFADGACQRPGARVANSFARVCFLIYALLVFYLLVTTWPVLVPESKMLMFRPFRFLGFGPYGWATDLRMLLTVILAGAVGSLIHTLTSFGDYVGNRRLGSSWMWWFVLRTPIGVSLAIVSSLILRGGLIAPTLHAPKDAQDLQDATALLNPYGIAAFAALAGMFSKQATDKFREVFETLFTTQKAVPRAEPLAGRPTPTVDPETLTVGNPQVVTVTGRGFDRNMRASIDGKPRTLEWISDTQARITPLADDVAKAGRIELLIRNGERETFVVPLEVVAPPAGSASRG